MSRAVIYDKAERQRRLVRIAQSIMPFADARLVRQETHIDFAEIGVRSAAGQLQEASEIAEKLVRQVLPLVDLRKLSGPARRDVLCEFTQMRATAYEAPLHCEDVKPVFTHDCVPIMAEGRVGGKTAWVSALPGELEDRENWITYMVMVPDEATDKAFRDGDICMREMTLAEGTALFTMVGPNDMSNMEIMQGPIQEQDLCDPGLFLQDVIEVFESEADGELLPC